MNLSEVSDVSACTTRTLPWRIRRLTPETGSITKAFTCSNGLARMIAFGYDDRNRNSR